MKSNAMVRECTLAFLALICLSVAGLGQTITLTPKVGSPTSNIQVAGSGFSDHTAVDLYFDATDEALAVTSATGTFSAISIAVPAAATPTTHYVTAVQRSNGNAAQMPFTVNTNWGQFHFQSNHNGLNSFENVLNSANVGNMDLLWKSPIAASASSPTVGNGTVYIGSASSVYAIKASTGALLWQDAIATSQSTPAVSNGVVYVGATTNNLYALKAASGATMWTFTTTTQVTSSPAVANNVVYFTSGNSVYAVAAATGTKIWQYTTTGDILQSSPAVANGVVFAGSNSDNIYALNATTGALLFHFATGLAVNSPPTVSYGEVYFGCTDAGDTYVCGLDASNSSDVWLYSTSSTVQDAPAVANRLLYAGSDSGSFMALAAPTGMLKWSYATGAQVSSSPAVANGVVYVGSGDGNLYAFDDLGTPLWQFLTGGGIYTSPAVSNGVVYVSSSDGNLYAFGLTGGSAAGRANRRPDPKTLRPDLGLTPARSGLAAAGDFN